MKNQFFKALSSLGRRGRHNGVKIVCLAVGLAAGAVLVGKVGFEGSWDSFFPTSGRTYVVSETIVRDGEFKEFPQTAGAIGPGLARYCPQVEAATRLTSVLYDMPLLTDGDRQLRANLHLVDSCFFDVFPFRVLAGNARQVLSQPHYCMIPRSLAEKLVAGGQPSADTGGETAALPSAGEVPTRRDEAAFASAVGLTLYLFDQQGLAVTVGGIYEDIPLNSTLHDVQVMLSMPTIGKLLWDGRDNWVGNDRYRTFVRLAEGTYPDQLRPLWQKMMRENVDMEQLSEAGLEMGFSFMPINTFNLRKPDARRMQWILSILAFVLIFCAVMNYLLLVVGGITTRAREMAVHKCYGAQRRQISAMVFAESVVHLLLSLALAVLLLLVCRDTVEQLTGVPLPVLMTCGSNLLLLLVVTLVVLLVTGLVPAWLYIRVPVITAFQGYRQSHRHWKFLLLGLQLASAVFLITLLVVIQRQYLLMVNDDPGYEYRDLALFDRHELRAADLQLLVDELRKLSSVESVTTATVALVSGQSGDNITLPGDTREYMNVADLYFTGDGYFQTMQIPVLSGRTFTEGSDTLREVMVSRRFEERMRELAGWDRAVGKQVLCSSFQGPYTIVGVYADVRLGSIAYPDERPSVMFYHHTIGNEMPVVLVKFHHKTAEALTQVNTLANRLLPGREVVFEPYTQVMANLYESSRNFRQMVLIGGLVALVIALIGLVGYIVGEVARRQKEVAVRKVNGARTRDVLRLFGADMLRVALPSVAIGSVGAYAVARLWLQQFSEKTALTPGLFVGCMLAVLAVVLAVVCAGCYRVANGNPVNYLRSEK